MALQEHDIAELGNIENVHRDEEPVNGEEFPAASAEHAAIYLSKLFEVDPSLQFHDMEEVVDNLLLYCGECCSIIDKVREESKSLLSISMPQFYEKRAAMQGLFNQIDALQEFISVIKNNVEEMEQSVQLAEKQLGSKNFKKIISSIPIPSFLSQKKQTQSLTDADLKNLEPNIPATFKTDNHLHCDTDFPDDSGDSASSKIADIAS